MSTSTTFSGTLNYKEANPAPVNSKSQCQLVLQNSTFTYTQETLEIICESVITEKWNIQGTFSNTAAQITCTITQAQHLYDEQGDEDDGTVPPVPTFAAVPSAIGQVLIFAKQGASSIKLTSALQGVKQNVVLIDGSGSCIMM